MSLTILYLADPNSIHDIKWMEYMVSKRLGKIYLVSRKVHDSNIQLNGVIKLKSIPDFSHIRFYRTLIGAYKINRLIKKHRIDLVHIMYAEPNALWCVFRKYFKVPMIITCRGTDVLLAIPEAFKKKTPINYLVAPSYKLAFRQADWVTGTSQRQIESVKLFSGKESQMSIVRTGVDTKRIQSDTSLHFSLKDNKPFILFPRYIKPVYNHEFSLAAISLLSPSIKANYKMVFVGKDNGDVAYQQILEKLMNSLPDVEFEFVAKQSQEGIFELYKRTSLVVMTPTSDGSPVSGMEAMLCGAKLILGPLDYDPDIFSPAIQLKQWDTHELAEAITNALTESVQAELTEKTKLLMDRNYNMQKMMEIYKMLSLKHTLFYQ